MKRCDVRGGVEGGCCSRRTIGGTLRVSSFQGLDGRGIVRFASVVPCVRGRMTVRIVGRFPMCISFTGAMVRRCARVYRAVLTAGGRRCRGTISTRRFILRSFSGRLRGRGLATRRETGLSSGVVTRTRGVARLCLRRRGFRRQVVGAVNKIMAIALNIALALLKLGMVKDSSSLPRVNGSRGMTWRFSKWCGLR